MKNLLVDALRQASGQDPRSPSEEARAEAAHDKSVADANDARDKDLQLVESTVLPASLAPRTPPVESDVAEDIADVATEADREKAEVEQDEVDGVVDPTMLVPALSLSDAQEPGASDVVKSRSRSLSPAPQARPNRGLCVTLGRWSPALCLIALSAAAASFALYQKMTAQNLNFDLGALPEQVGRDVTHQDPNLAWQALSGGKTTDEAVLSPSLESTPMPASSPAGSTVDGRMLGEPRLAGDPADLQVVHANKDQIEDPAFADVQAGFEAYRDGNLADAERLYRRALATDANHRHALAGLAAVLQRTSRSGESMPIYERLLVLDPQDTSAAASLLAHAKSADPAENETRVKVLIQSHPEAAALHFSMGLLLAERARWPDAHQAFRNANSLAPGNADYSYNVAVSAQHLGRVETARSFYEAALATVGGDSLVDRQTISQQLARLSSKLGDPS